MQRLGIKADSLLTKTLFFAFGVMGLLLLNAFIYQDSKHVCRYEFASMIEELLIENGISNKNLAINEFKDLEAVKHYAIANTVGLEIMTGFADNTFRPSEKIRIIEAVAYLQRLSQVFFEQKPRAKASKRLMRLFAYQIDAKDVLLSAFDGMLPKQFSELDAFLEKDVLGMVFKVLYDLEASGSRHLVGEVIDAISGRRVSGVFISVGSRVLKSDDRGCFRLDIGEKTENIDLFVAREGYEPLEIRKNILFEQSICLILKKI